VAGKLLLATTAVALLGVTAPAAHASTVRASCGFDTVGHETLTGNTFAGAAYGFAVFSDAGTHTLRCYVTVDGVERAGTEPGTGVALVVTAGEVSYDAPVTADVTLCTEVDGVTTSCGTGTPNQIPPQEVIDAIDMVFDAVDDALAPVYSLLDTCYAYGCGGPVPDLDTLLCPVFQSLAPGVPGVVDVTSRGDVTIAGVGPFWDCPPYGDLFPPS
jgi:hypothetical protein